MYKFSVTKQDIESKLVGIFVCLISLFFALPSLAAGIVPMGQITLAVGQATVTSAVGSTTVARRGDAIAVGDRIETTLNGHVHVRFVDGALVSVRPASELLIEDYRYDPAAADKSQVKFKLSRGTARAISGAAAEGARDHFRLNTPLVAIGIRGTDFVVHSNDYLTTAAVSYGAILMTPFGDGCRVQGSGPCATPTARFLSADMSGMLAEYRNGLAQPELKQTVAYNAQLTDLARTSSVGSAKTAATGSSNGSSASTSPLSGTGSPVTATPEATSAAVNELSRIPFRANNLVDPDSRNADHVTTAAVLAVESDKPGSPGSSIPPTVALPSLVWGRWGSDAVGPGDFSVVRSEAQTGRTLTVGNDKFVLYRNDGDFDFARFASSQGETGFVLDKSFAQYNDGSGKAEAASVLGGSLGINFSSRQFSTALTMTSASTGAQTLALQGAVDRSGFFIAGQDGQRIAGAIALDGRSAGYLFDKAVANGSLSGITQWKVK